MAVYDEIESFSDLYKQCDPVLGNKRAGNVQERELKNLCINCTTCLEKRPHALDNYGKGERLHCSFWILLFSLKENQPW